MTFRNIITENTEVIQNEFPSNTITTNYEVVIVLEIPIVIFEVIFGVETESGLRITPSRQVFA